MSKFSQTAEQQAKAAEGYFILPHPEGPESL